MPAADGAVAGATPRTRPPAWWMWLSLLVGGLGIVLALVVPFAPVWSASTRVSWPEQGREPASTTAFFVPYAPAEAHVTVPCPVVRAGQQRDAGTTLVSSTLPGKPTRGFLISTADDDVLVLVGGRQVYRGPILAGDCSVRMDSSAASGSTVRVGQQELSLPQDHVREIFAFATDLPPEQASGLTVRARTSAWFDNSPTGSKRAVIFVQLALAATALVLLALGDRWRRKRAASKGTVGARIRGRRLRPGLLRVGVDVAVVGIVGYWAVVGPRSPDDSFTEAIVRNALRSGALTNYYRWENAGEAPFTLVLHLLEPLVSWHADPVLLRIPSVVAGLATWVLLSRAVLPCLLPRLARRAGVRALAAVGLLSWWLPFDLGVRPEPFVALGTTAVLACVLRGTSRVDGAGLTVLGLGGLAAGLTVAVNPIGIVAAAPVLVAAPRIWRTLRGPAAPGALLAGLGALAMVGALAAVGAVVMFADQSWFGAMRATELHRFYGPNVPWFEEIRRYEYLLGFESQGGLGRRLPVLLTLSLVACAALLLARGARRLPGLRHVWIPVVTLVVALGLLWLTPSKWTHYFGALAGIGAAALVAGVVLVRATARHWARQPAMLWGVGVAGTAVTVLAASVVFAGENTWFLFSRYGVPHDDTPFWPLNTPLPWILFVAVVLLVGLARRRSRSPRRLLARMPALVGLTALEVGMAVLLVSFALAPLRQADSYSVGGQSLAWLGGGSCGIVDDVAVIQDEPDGELTSTGGPAELTGFTAQGGYPSDSAPPDPPGSGPSTYLWGSIAEGPVATGNLDSPWFDLPPVRQGQELAVNVAGRTGDGNRLTLEFAHSTAGGPRVVGQRRLDDAYKDSDERPTYPSDRVVEDKPQDNPNWRTLYLNPGQVPGGADLVRVQAVDDTSDPGGWLAVTGPRIRHVEPLDGFLKRQGGPIYVDWSMTWPAPCVRANPTVRHGLVQAPTLLLNPPDRLGFDGQAAYVREIGGSFTGVDEIGSRQELSTRLRGSQDRPDYADWGHLVQVSYPMQRDAYDTRPTRDRRWGWQGDPALLGEVLG